MFDARLAAGLLLVDSVAVFRVGGNCSGVEEKVRSFLFFPNNFLLLWSSSHPIAIDVHAVGKALEAR